MAGKRKNKKNDTPKTRVKKQSTGPKKAASKKATTVTVGATKKATSKKAKRVAKKKGTGGCSVVKAQSKSNKPKTSLPKRSAKQKKLPLGVFSPPDFPIVGIGASAGGLHAFEEFLQNMPAETGVAFVLISHLDPNRASILHELLRKSSALPVQQIVDGTVVEMNQVYVSPPGKEVAILNGTLQLMKPTKPHGSRLPIDYWFRSLAEDQGSKSIGIILSGNGSDGVLGAKAIKGASGMMMAQDPESAGFSGMPCSAIATGLVDYVLPASKMPKRLLAYVQSASFGEPKEDLDLTTPIPTALQKIFVMLRSRTGHDFSFYKTSTLRRRIFRRMNLHEIKDHKHYIRYLEENPQEIDLLFKELLIGVTSFFRDQEAFEALNKKVITELLASNTGDLTIRVWVPGCSTGEEAYSIAILLRESMESAKQPCNVQIFATDLDPQAIETARAGLYPEGIRADVNPERLRKYFIKDNDLYRIKKEIREAVIFAEQNLIKDPPLTKLDIISCRNLLIYLRPDLQKRLLPLFHYALKPNGFLFLGTSETVGTDSELFLTIDKKWKLFARKAGSITVDVAPAYPKRVTEFEAGDSTEQISSTTLKPSNLAEMSWKLLSERYAPPSVIVNERGDLIYVHGQTGLYLQPASGTPSHNILSMAREGLRFELAAALRKATRLKGDIFHKGIHVKSNGGFIRVDLKVNKITSPETMRGLLLVTFAAASEMAPAQKLKPPKKLSTKNEKVDREAALEQELQYVRESLQSTIEELETSNEELKSTNEELQSTNEEMQSINEELETSKEEMQSLNEELQTVNSELQGKIEELSHANDDMSNLLNATDIATIFVDNNLHIKRFTRQATDVIRVITSDVGRPISDLASKLDYNLLEQEVTEVLRTLSSREAEVKSHDGTWFLMRILPYRTSENVIDGAVITFVDISRVKIAEEGLVQAKRQLEEASAIRRLATVVQDSNDAVTVQDLQGNITAWNRTAEQMYGLTEEEALGTNISRIIPEEFRESAFTMFRSVVAGKRIELLRAKRTTKDGEEIDVELTLTALRDEAGNVCSVCTTERYIDDKG